MKRPETDYRTYRLSRREWLIYGAAGCGIAAASAYVFYRNIIAFVLLSPLAVLYPIYKKSDLKAARDRRLTEEFRECIMTLSSALSAGYSPENAMKETESELRLIYGAESMMVGELEHMNHLIVMNIGLEKAWSEFAERSGNEDILNFAQVIRIAKRNGGDLDRIISATADAIGDKIRVKEEILTMTAGRRFEQKIMNIIPFAIVIYIDVTSPGFFDMMYRTFFGRAVMTACLMAFAGAVVLAGRILNIEI